MAAESLLSEATVPAGRAFGRTRFWLGIQPWPWIASSATWRSALGEVSLLRVQPKVAQGGCRSWGHGDYGSLLMTFRLIAEWSQRGLGARAPRALPQIRSVHILNVQGDALLSDRTHLHCHRLNNLGYLC